MEIKIDEAGHVTLHRSKNIVGRLQKYRYIAYDIFEKYIRIGSEYEINIDYMNRKRYFKIMHNKKAWLYNHNRQHYGHPHDQGLAINAQFLQEAMILFSLYQPCIDQMYRFCSSCFLTFKNTPDFEHLTDLFEIKSLKREDL